MSFFSRGLFVVAGIIAGTTGLNYFVFGNTADYGLPNERLGAWREAQVRPACYRALEFPQNDRGNPKLPYGQHRIDMQDHLRMVDMTAALHCYVVTQGYAVCEPNNRAYIVDYASKYFAKRDAMLDAAKRYGDEDVRNVRELWDSPNNRAVMAALADHIGNGRLIKRDFGFSAPAALNGLFEKNPQPADGCRGKQPWVASRL